MYMYICVHVYICMCIYVYSLLLIAFGHWTMNASRCSKQMSQQTCVVYY